MAIGQWGYWFQYCQIGAQELTSLHKYFLTIDMVGRPCNTFVAPLTKGRDASGCVVWLGLWADPGP